MGNSLQNNTTVWGTKIEGGIRDNRDSLRHWRQMPQDYSLRTKPKKVLVLSGKGVQTAKAANGMCKVVENLLGTAAKNCEICGCYYPENEKTVQNTALRAMEIVDKFLVPLIADKDENGNLTKLSFAQACRNMRNVVVVTHCYGSRVMAVIDEQLDQIMRDIGYSETQAKLIHRQLFVAHHNNPREDLGSKALNSTNLYRITQADERNTPEEFVIGSLQHFISTEEMVDDELLLMPISATEHALVIKRISDGVESEHNGGYWIKPYEKLSAARLEETAFRIVLQEVVGSNYPIENLTEIEEKAWHGNPDIQDYATQIREYGQEFADDYFSLRQALTERYKINKNLLDSGRLGAVEIAKLTEKDLFFSSNDGKTLFDYSFAKGDVTTCRNLWLQMQKYLPLGRHDDAVQSVWKNTSEDHKAQYERYCRYMQQAQQSGNISMYETLRSLEYGTAENDNLKKFYQQQKRNKTR